MGLKGNTSTDTASATLVLLGLSALLALPTVAADFKWPEPVVHTGTYDVMNDGVLGVRGVVMPNVREKISRRNYTEEEHRNVQATMDAFVRPRRENDAPFRSKDFKGFIGPGGFYVMHTAFINEFKLKPRSNDGYSQYSFISRLQEIEDILAKGNRVILSFRITGQINGPFFGFKGIGQGINVREQLIYTFDAKGLPLTFIPWSSEDLPFYQQLGGKLEFTKNLNPVALTVAAPSVIGAPPAPKNNDELEVRAIAGVDYTSDEQRNMRTLLGAIGSVGGFDVPNKDFFTRDYRNTDTSAYPTLEMAQGSSGGFKLASLAGLKRQVTDVFIKGDRAWVYFVTTALHSGPLFGVAGTGKLLSWDEGAFVTFSEDGKIKETTRFPVQGELYLKLGGQYTFPYGKYWSCDGCPTAPGIAVLNIPGVN